MFFYAMEYCPLGSLEAPERPLERREILVAVAQAAQLTARTHCTKPGWFIVASSRRTFCSTKTALAWLISASSKP